MPNWCYNTVEIRHNDPAMMRRLMDAQDGILEAFIPCPKELLDAKSPADPDTVKVNLEKYGAKDWYDWCVNNWGVKWDIALDNAFLDEDEKYLTATFDSAWSPPIEAYQKLEEMGFVISAMYHEPGMSFVGEYEDGEDYCLNYEFADDDVWDAHLTENMKDMLQGEYECWLEWQEEEEEKEEEKANVA